MLWCFARLENWIKYMTSVSGAGIRDSCFCTRTFRDAHELNVKTSALRWLKPVVGVSCRKINSLNLAWILWSLHTRPWYFMFRSLQFFQFFQPDRSNCFLSKVDRNLIWKFCVKATQRPLASCVGLWLWRAAAHWRFTKGFTRNWQIGHSWASRLTRGRYTSRTSENGIDLISFLPTPIVLGEGPWTQVCRSITVFVKWPKKVRPIRSKNVRKRKMTSF